MVKISVIYTFYNAGTFLDKTLKSIQLQSLKDIEIICVDNGSDDLSLSQLKRYAQKDPRIKLIHLERGILSIARNKGIKCASGEFITFMEKNGFYPRQDVLQNLYSVAKEKKSLICGGNVAILNSTTEKLNQDKKSTPFLFDGFVDFQYHQINTHFQRFLYNNQFLKENNLFFPQYAYEDTNLFLTMVLHRAKQFYTINKTVYAYKTSEFHWNKEKIINYWYSTVDILKLAFLQNYVFLKQDCISKLRKIYPIIEKFIEQDEHLDLLKMTSFLYKNVPIKVSIIIPVYNAKKYLKKCLESALSQSLKEIEIICVNDGSTDESLAILNEYAKKDERIVVLTQENQHQGIARNTGMKQATGEYIQYLDADDILPYNSSEYLYLYAKLNSLDMLNFCTNDWNEDMGEEYNSAYTNLAYSLHDIPPVFNARMIRKTLPKLPVSACLTFYRYDFLEQNHIYWTALFYEDTLFFTKSILMAERVGMLKARLYTRTIHSDSTIGSFNENFGDFIKILSQTFDVVHELANKETLTCYVSHFLTKAYIIILQKLLPKSRDKIGMEFYHLCCESQKKYHILLPAEIEKFTTRYTINKEPFLLKMMYFKTLYLLKFIKYSQYVSFVSFERYPGGFKLQFLGIPLLFKNPPKYQDLLK